jgi:hypothetical protein
MMILKTECKIKCSMESAFESVLNMDPLKQLPYITAVDLIQQHDKEHCDWSLGNYMKTGA